MPGYNGRDTIGSGAVRKAVQLQEHHSSDAKALTNDKFAEVSIFRDQDPAVRIGHLNGVFVRRSLVGLRHRDHVMAIAVFILQVVGREGQRGPQVFPLSAGDLLRVRPQRTARTKLAQNEFDCDAGALDARFAHHDVGDRSNARIRHVGTAVDDPRR